VRIGSSGRVTLHDRELAEGRGNTTAGTRHTAREEPVLPRSGDVLRVTWEASVQFTEPMMFRVIRVHDWPTYDGWVWLDGYQLDGSGDAVERRSIFVRVTGLRPARRALSAVPSPSGP
jgi:hypothetical protein